ncbi:hypothetical protein V8C26DRAFT_121689 [Trichoderma gracile]
MRMDSRLLRQIVRCMLQSERTGWTKGVQNGRRKKATWRKTVRYDFDTTRNLPRDVTATWCLCRRSFSVSPRAQTHRLAHPTLATAADASKHLSQSSGLQPHCTHYAARCDKGRQAKTQDVSGGRGSDVFWRMEGSWLNRIPGCYWCSSTPGPCSAPCPEPCVHASA